jgi:hypothetical protein
MADIFLLLAQEGAGGPEKHTKVDAEAGDAAWEAIRQAFNDYDFEPGNPAVLCCEFAVVSPARVAPRKGRCGWRLEGPTTFMGKRAEGVSLDGTNEQAEASWGLTWTRKSAMLTGTGPTPLQMASGHF